MFMLRRIEYMKMHKEKTLWRPGFNAEFFLNIKENK